jgi:hypothetical protein
MLRQNLVCHQPSDGVVMEMKKTDQEKGAGYFHPTQCIETLKKVGPSTKQSESAKVPSWDDNIM